MLINGLQDVGGTWDGQSNMQFTVHHCIAASTRLFTVTMWGPVLGTFAVWDVSGGGIHAIPFRVAYADANGTFRDVTPGIPLFLQTTTDNNPNNGCNATMQLRITFEASALSKATIESYLGLLTIRVD